MIEDLLTKNEGKTLEFKENAKPLAKIIQTIIAFANTAGGIVVIGVKDKSKEVIGVKDPLQDEERIANAISDSIEPLVTPNIQLCSWRQRDLLIIQVPYSIGPYYLKTLGREKGTYIRFGSTNRTADTNTLDEIKRAKSHLYYDELPCYRAKGSIDFDLIKELFAKVSKRFTTNNAKSMDIIVNHRGYDVPTNGGVLLFGEAETRSKLFPSSTVRCARFKGTSKVTFLDQADISQPLPLLVDDILDFIRKHTTIGFDISKTRRKEVFQYPPQVVREAVINAIVHADYSIKGSTIQVAIYDDRIEITNPGALPYGLSLESALSGFSQLRNKVIGKTFRELGLIEHWGTGLKRMIEICREQSIMEPEIKEVDHYFKVTLYPNSSPKHTPKSPRATWESTAISHLNQHGKVTVKEAQAIWNVTSRTASTRLKKMVENGIITELSTGPFDPYKTFVLP